MLIADMQVKLWIISEIFRLYAIHTHVYIEYRTSKCLNFRNKPSNCAYTEEHYL